MTCQCQPEHLIFSGPHRLEGPGLLGTRDQFCTAAFHVFRCREFEEPEHVCLHDDPKTCSHRNMTLILKWQQPDQPVRWVRYTNCQLGPRYVRHAEETLVADRTLLTPHSSLQLFMQYQPCHHSGRSDASPPDPRSCTELLIRWFQQELRPRHITLVIRCFSLYKAMWYFSAEDMVKLPAWTRYAKSARLARQGLALLLENGIHVEALRPADWDELVSLLSSDPGITLEQWQARFRFDRKIQAFLADRLEALPEL